MKTSALLLFILLSLMPSARADSCSLDAQQKEGAVRELLSDVAKRGLRGDHHYSITFLTAAKGVVIPPHVAAKYPEQTSIILQHQFENLRIASDRFEVKLWFGGKPARVVVPFNAVIVLIDPSVNVRIEFDPASRGTDCRSSHLDGDGETDRRPQQRQSVFA